MKVVVRGSEVAVGDILSDIWWFPEGGGEIESLSPYEGYMLYFAGEGSQIATVKGVTNKLVLPQINWYVVERK